MKSDEICAVLLIGGLALALLVFDRIYRVEPILLAEGFQGFSTSVQRCGVDMAPCPYPKRCMNGLCRSPDEPVLRDRNPLPVVP
jgi:hypothetical protein